MRKLVVIIIAVLMLSVPAVAQAGTWQNCIRVHNGDVTVTMQHKNLTCRVAKRVVTTTLKHQEKQPYVWNYTVKQDGHKWKVVFRIVSSEKVTWNITSSEHQVRIVYIGWMK